MTGQPIFQIGEGVNPVGGQIVDGRAVAFQIPQLGFSASCPCVAT